MKQIKHHLYAGIPPLSMRFEEPAVITSFIVGQHRPERNEEDKV